MSNALTVHDDMSLSDLGNVLAKSGFFQDARDASQAIVKVLAGRELGFGPIASMTGVYIVKGRPALSANLMAAAIKRSGRYTYRVVRLDDQACEIAFFENGQEIGRSQFTADDAKRAGTQNMDKFPRNMLFARALSNGAKWFCPDIFGGPVYTPEELGAAVDEDGDVIDGQVIISSPAYSELANNPPPAAQKSGKSNWEQIQDQLNQPAPPPAQPKNGGKPWWVGLEKLTTPKGTPLCDLNEEQLKVVAEKGTHELQAAAKHLLGRVTTEDMKAWSALYQRAKKVGVAPEEPLGGDTTGMEFYRRYTALDELVRQAEAEVESDIPVEF